MHSQGSDGGGPRRRGGANLVVRVNVHLEEHLLDAIRGQLRVLHLHKERDPGRC